MWRLRRYPRPADDFPPARDDREVAEAVQTALGLARLLLLVALLSLVGIVAWALT